MHLEARLEAMDPAGDPDLSCLLVGFDRDDVRLLRLLVRYAARCPHATQVFEWLEDEGVGLGHALLYEASAAELERQRDFAGAEARYFLGLERFAEPLERLRRRHEEFRKRMARRRAREERQKRTSPAQDVPTSPPRAPSNASRVASPELPELPVQQAFVPVERCESEIDEPRVLARITTDWKGRSLRESRASCTELTVGLRASLAEARSFSFEDPTYTAELARRDVLALFGEATPQTVQLARCSSSRADFEVFEETDLRNL